MKQTFNCRVRLAANSKLMQGRDKREINEEKVEREENWDVQKVIFAGGVNIKSVHCIIYKWGGLYITFSELVT